MIPNHHRSIVLASCLHRQDMELSDTSDVDNELRELRLRIRGVNGRLCQQQLEEAVTRFETLTRFRKTLQSMAPPPEVSAPSALLPQPSPLQQPLQLAVAAATPASDAANTVG